MKPDFEIIKSIITPLTISIATGVLYLSGVFYDGGFLETLKIESSLFPRNIEEHIFTGGIILFTDHMSKLLHISLALLVIFAISHIAWLEKDSRIIKKLLLKPATQVTVPQEHHVKLLSIKTQALYSFVFGLSFALIIILTAYTLISSYNSGVRAAEKDQLIQSKTPEKVNSTILLNNGSSHSGYIIRCSESVCAILSKNLVTILQRSEIYKIETITKSEKI